MNVLQQNYFRSKLEKEEKNAHDLLGTMRNNDTIDSKAEMSSELSFYDNHPGDTSTELNDIERGMALKKNEQIIIDKIHDSLEDIEKGSYGICKKCGKEIPRERLEFLPYAKYCASCQKEMSRNTSEDLKDRSSEEDVISFPYGSRDRLSPYNNEYDGDDAYEDVENYNKLHNVEEYFGEGEEYVDPIEKISNEQYKRTLE